METIENPVPAGQSPDNKLAAHSDLAESLAAAVAGRIYPPGPPTAFADDVTEREFRKGIDPRIRPPSGAMPFLDGERVLDTGFKEATVKSGLPTVVPDSIRQELTQHVKEAKRFQTELIRVKLNGKSARDLAEALLKLPAATKVSRINGVRVDPADGILMFELD